MKKLPIYLPGLITVIIAISILILFASFLHYDPTFFVFAGGKYTDPEKTPDQLYIFTESVGYDGQFYYRLSLNPLTNRLTEFGITLDSPRYRHQRILYPLLNWLVTFGKAELVPYSMLLINLLGLVSIATCGGIIARDFGYSALWGCAFSLFIGLLLSLTNNLTEILEITFILLGIILVKKSPLYGMFFFTLAVLSKETALLVPTAYLLADLIQIRKINPYYLVPILVFLCWEGVLFYIWRDYLSPDVTTNLGFPLVGLFTLINDSLVKNRYTDMGFLFAFSIIFLLTAWVIIKKRPPLPLTITWMLYSLLMASLSWSVFQEYKNYLRAFSEWYVFSLIILLGYLFTVGMSRKGSIEGNNEPIRLSGLHGDS